MAAPPLDDRTFPDDGTPRWRLIRCDGNWELLWQLEGPIEVADVDAISMFAQAITYFPGVFPRESNR